MKYSGIQTNKNLRFLKCPVCGNDEFSHEAQFCRVCGSATYNFCQDQYDQSGYKISNGCEKPNPGNARYCEYCGNPTLLFKYLSHWDEENNHNENYSQLNEDDIFCIDVPQTAKDEVASGQCEIADPNKSSNDVEQSPNLNNLSAEFEELSPKG